MRVPSSRPRLLIHLAVDRQAWTHERPPTVKENAQLISRSDKDTVDTGVRKTPVQIQTWCCVASGSSLTSLSLGFPLCVMKIHETVDVQALGHFHPHKCDHTLTLK